MLLYPLPISANHTADTRIHHPRHVDNEMQMVRHKAELENTDCRIMPAHNKQLINNSIAQCHPLNLGMRRVIIRNHQRPEQRLTCRHSQRDVIHPDAPPCSPRLLPLPLLFFRHCLLLINSMLSYLFQTINPFCNVAENFWRYCFLNLSIFIRESGGTVLEEMI